jgi:thioredoxin-like negative regulator of GroEL
LPVVEKVAREFSGRARFTKVHVDKEGQVLERFGASGLPSYLLFRDGKEIDRIRFRLGWFLETRLGRMVEAGLEEPTTARDSDNLRRHARSSVPSGKAGAARR